MGGPGSSIGLQRASAKHPAIQRTPGNNPNSEVLCSRKNLELRQPAQQAVLVLFGYQAEEMARLGSALCQGEIPASKVTGADIADFPLACR
ncbi:hypothetical protein D3C72_1634190 [compost metagenome]